MSMHESPYKTADELGITEQQRECLIGLSADLAIDRVEDFNMLHFEKCICGQIKKRLGHADQFHTTLRPLYMMDPKYFGHYEAGTHRKFGPAHAAVAIQNFLLGVDARAELV